MHENIRSFGKIFDEFHSFASELNHAAGVIVFSKTWFSANTCHGVQGYTGFHTYRADETGGGVSVFIRNCYTSTHMAKFSVCHAYYEISVAKVSLSNNCTIIIIGVYRPPDKSKIPEFTIKLNEILLSTSQYDHVFIVGDRNINLLDPIAIENDFINNCHSNSLIPLINKPTRNANNNPSIPDHIWSNQLYDTFSGIFIRYNRSLPNIYHCPNQLSSEANSCKIYRSFRTEFSYNLKLMYNIISTIMLK